MPTNIYTEPTAGTALNTARLQQNDNFRSLLTNFYGSAAPTSANLYAGGTTFAVPNGMFFRSSTTGALYINDSVNKRYNNIGGNFTRMGIGIRVESTPTSLLTNKAAYEQGEIIGVISTGTLYFRNGTTGGDADFVAIGEDNAYTMDVNSNVTFNGQRVDAARIRATSNLIAGSTTTPSATLHVVGTGLVTGNTAFSANVTVGSRIGVSTTNPTSNLHIVGNAFISTTVSVGTFATVGANLTVSGNTIIAKDLFVTGDISSTSDKRLKENVERIEKALDKVRQLEGVYYNMINVPGRKIGVIAQQVETVIPEVVNNSGDFKTVAYGNISGLLIEAIKELDKDIQKIKEVLNV